MNAVQPTTANGQRPEIATLESRVLGRCFLDCAAAVQAKFQHLTIESVIEPPHPWFDAALARQIVFHLMINTMGWARRRIENETGISRETVLRGARTVDARRAACTNFEKTYQAISDDAVVRWAERRDAA